ncbi:phospholipase D10 [Zea mays]|uniref:phospholipase D n=1 Tax=Zea mays TaxID=4577 RepID=A0A1D6EU79_MAIZE|nr:phospholipase D10 [Zea mays]
MASPAGGESPAKPVLLHGDLDLWILEARLLPNMDMFSEQVRRCLAVCRPPTSCGTNHPPAAARGGGGRQHHHRKIITRGPYVTLSVSGAVVARTAVIPNSQDPVWEERFAVPLAHRAAELEFQVKDNDTFGAQLIGTVTVPADCVVSGTEAEDWFPVKGTNGKPYKPDTALRLRFTFHPIANNPAYRHGIPGDPGHRGIGESYYPLRHGGQVTLYQDAHIREGDLPEIELDDGKTFQHNSCWEDICHAILEAHHMIYIVGWSVYDKVRLVREPSPSRPLPDGGDLTLGDLLKFKSQEGVRVCLLVWDDKTSHDKFFIKTVFRSIDSGSLKGFPSDCKEASKLNLVCRKNLVIDKSIHTAYVRAIRSAQHFIYIENQYFLGSSYAWPSYVNSGADNLIPIELALKIASKIRAQERFAVYVVIPMWPEGVPTAASVQEILFFQAQTMEMMYTIIADELKSMDNKDMRPEDYLSFFCLGNREEPPSNGSPESEKSTDKSAVGLATKYRRFMIYVHAKGMIVDDEYVILGSANINQRSLAGSRDTEIAMGAYQPHYAWSTKNGHPDGQVYGYRTSLWAEHLGTIDDRFKDPSSLECVRFVNQIAVENWRRYTAEEMSTLQGHLLKYPVKVEADGKISPLPDQECFPDVGGKILGASTSLPDSLTM